MVVRRRLVVDARQRSFVEVVRRALRNQAVLGEMLGCCCGALLFLPLRDILEAQLSIAYASTIGETAPVRATYRHGGGAAGRRLQPRARRWRQPRHCSQLHAPQRRGHTRARELHRFRLPRHSDRRVIRWSSQPLGERHVTLADSLLVTSTILDEQLRRYQANSRSSAASPGLDARDAGRRRHCSLTVHKPVCRQPRRAKHRGRGG